MQLVRSESSGTGNSFPHHSTNGIGSLSPNRQVSPNLTSHLLVHSSPLMIHTSHLLVHQWLDTYTHNFEVTHQISPSPQILPLARQRLDTCTRDIRVSHHHQADWEAQEQEGNGENGNQEGIDVEYVIFVNRLIRAMVFFSTEVSC